MTRRHADTNVIFGKGGFGGRGLFLSLFFCALFLSVGAVSSYAEDVAATANTTTSKAKTEILVDDEAGTVSILINGEIAVLIDADGLHVRGGIEYGGTIVDMGRENAIPVKDNKEADHEE